MQSLTRTRKVGGSLMVTIPKELVKGESLVEGELVEVSIKKTRKSGFGILKGIGPFTEKDELDTEL